MILLPSSYLPPITWFRKFLNDECRLDIHEHYLRQTIRNRATICGPNGRMDLIVPVHAPNHTPMREVRIEYTEDWQRRHWGAIRSAYGKSPFFDFYADRFHVYYSSQRWKFLIDLNHDLLNEVLDILKVNKHISATDEFIAYKPDDLRLDSWQLPPPDMHFGTYVQVFSDRFPFQVNLSILDLLCCVGPDAKSYLHP